MEVKEAIEHCDEIIKKMDNCECRKEHEELKEFLEELQKYRDTGLTPQEIMELKERDTAKVPDDTDDEYDMYVCPNCDMAIGTIGDKKEHHFCLNCGQRLKWEESPGALCRSRTGRKGARENERN